MVVAERTCLIALTLTKLLGAGVTSGATLTVCQSGCDSTTVQGAATAANPGDTI